MTWRHLERHDRNDFLIEVGKSLAARQQVGERTYGNEFQGEPLDHAWEELLDALFYVWIAKRRQKEIENG